MSKWLKMALLAALLIGAGYFFGIACKQFGQAYTLILSPSWELLSPLLWFLLALGAVAVTAGLVAALLRPVWVGFLAFALSALAILLGWQVTVVGGILVAVYLLAAFLYAMDVTKELNQRIMFSVRPIGEGQGMLRMGLILVACGSLYFGYAAHIEREGFSIPETYIEMFMEQMEKRVIDQVPAEQREEALVQVRTEFQRTIDEFLQRTVKPYEEFIPFVVAVSLFMTLVTVTTILALMVTAVLDLIFRSLAALGVTKVVTETQEVQKLIIG